MWPFSRRKSREHEIVCKYQRLETTPEGAVWNITIRAWFSVDHPANQRRIQNEQQNFVDLCGRLFEEQPFLTGHPGAFLAELNSRTDGLNAAEFSYGDGAGALLYPNWP